MKTTIRIAIALLLFPAGFLAAQGVSIFDQLEKEDVQTITLRTDISKLLDNRSGEVQEQTAVLTWENENKETVTWPLKVSVRGKFRRRTCDFPPIKLDFKKSELEARGLLAHDKMKLVTHCLEDRNDGNENVLREYLAYQLYNVISPASYRARLVKIQYVDEGGRINGFRRYAFIMEDTDQMAERAGAVECDKCLNPDPSELDLQAENVHAFFQYMIGNTDYSMAMERNLKLVRRPDGKLLPVGYDFDFSGLVNAPYAIPSTNLGQLAVRQRVFLGWQANDAIMLGSIRLFQSKKDEMIQTVRGFRQLSREDRLDVERYIESFYAELDTLLAGGNMNLYNRLREQFMYALPSGASPEHFGVAK